jgi:hypothetical protein
MQEPKIISLVSDVTDDGVAVDFKHLVTVADFDSAIKMLMQLKDKHCLRKDEESAIMVLDEESWAAIHQECSYEFAD